jgi:hypothetical protein
MKRSTHFATPCNAALAVRQVIFRGVWIDFPAGQLQNLTVGGFFATGRLCGSGTFGIRGGLVPRSQGEVIHAV